MSEFVQTATNVIKAMDPAKPEFDATKELLDVLSELGESKAAQFHLQIRTALGDAGIGSDKTFPISKIKEEFSEVHAYASDSAEHITEAVQNGLGKLFKTIKDGDWAAIANDSVGLAATAINTFITAFLGKASGSATSENGYAVVLDGIALMRLDYLIWSRDIHVQGIKAMFQKIVAVSYTRSYVDMSKVKKQEFRGLFQDLVKTSYKIDDPIKIIKKCDDLYDLLCASDVKLKESGFAVEL